MLLLYFHVGSLIQAGSQIHKRFYDMSYDIFRRMTILLQFANSQNIYLMTYLLTKYYDHFLDVL